MSQKAWRAALRKVALRLAVVLLVVVVLLAGLKTWADARFFEGYEPDLPLHPQAEEARLVDKTRKVFGIERKAHYRVEHLDFEARPGERVPTLVTFPPEFEGRLPVIVFLHGSHQDKEFVEEICTPFNAAGFAMASFDQHMRGDRDVGNGFIANAAGFRERTWKTVHDTRRLIDYLLTRPDIDPERVYLVGASYGAITGTTVVAMEPRIKAAILVVGGGDFGVMAGSPVVRKAIPRWAHPLAKGIVTFLLDAADPIHAAPHTGGTPVLMQNGTKDSVVIPAAGEALYAALAEPKEIRWYPIDHPDIEENGQAVLDLLEEGLAWLLERDAPFREEDSGTPAQESDAA